ncbi:fimbrillin family protein [Prevotella copri]|uniref:fimbrillin family protein n=1 Tax=Segatella copri TaxID=165179 RepID=UPI001C37FCFF|nr:fimbrillin family protein [Segatella copri]MBV3428292.1 fimbrillin family protein [Segatella copri]
MKAIKFFAISAMAAAMITSCSTDDELSQSNYPSDNIVRVTAGVNNAKTRADVKYSPMDKPFSLTIVNRNASKYTYTDKVFSKSSGDWACSDTLLWQDDKTPVDIVAFAPAQENKFNGVCDNAGNIKPIAYSVADDQSTKSDNNDLLYNYTPSFVPGGTNLDEKGRLSIQFNHAFCMIDIVVTLGTEFNKPKVLDDSPIVKVTLDGTKIAANVDVKNAASVVTASETATPTTITTTKGTFTKAANEEANAKSCFSCIAIPQKVAANTFKVSLMTAGKLYEWTSATPVELKSGYKYTLELSMGNDVVLLKNGSISASPWTEGDTGDKPLETD